MNELVNKISSYNFLNNLLPGAIFSVFMEKITSYSIIQNNLLIDIFLIYFAGLIINRIGSLMVEPVMRKLVVFTDYKEFVEASSKDEKLEVLSETNNIYRTFIALFVTIFAIKLYEIFFGKTEYDIYILCIALFFLFVFSYMKQINYINKRAKK